MLKVLREARDRAGITQAQVGQMLGKTQSHYAKIERGVAGLSASDAMKLCEHFGLELSDLIKNQH